MTNYLYVYFTGHVPVTGIVHTSYQLTNLPVTCSNFQNWSTTHL